MRRAPSGLAERPQGWGWFDDAEGAAEPEALRLAAAACFSGTNGRVVLDHLRRAYLERRVPPQASDAELRHAEGQRALAAHLLRLALGDDR